MLRNRRRPRYGAPVCAIISGVLLLLSVSLLYIRLNATSPLQLHPLSDQYDLNPFLSDTADLDYRSSDDPIDLSDDADALLDDPATPLDDDDDDDDSEGGAIQKGDSMFYYDHVGGVVRKGYSRRAIEDWEDYVEFEGKLRAELGFESEGGSVVFGSDDVAVDETIRESMVQVEKVEDALLLKGSRLREGWGEWFDKKSDFLRRDKMFRSNLELLNPLNNPMLQDPDGAGVTGFTRGDKIVIKGIMSGLKRGGEKVVSRAPDLEAKVEARREGKGLGGRDMLENSRRTEMKRAERRTLDDSRDLNNKVYVETRNNENEAAGNGAKLGENLQVSEGGKLKNEFSGEVHADGKRWGYYPGLDGNLSFSNFMDLFFKGNCSVRVFMVWNSPSWMYGVRHKRGLESVLFHHPDACVVVFSETIELNFFSEFVKEGFKVAVVMPNLDELLKDTPTHVFASVWYEWKQTKYYPVHYSELIRLAVLYKYGGVYLDSDIILIKPISSLLNTVGLEDEQDGSSLNGAVMASDKHSHFIMECLKEFYASYDDTNLLWNGADLLSRVAGNLSSSQNHANKLSDLTLLPRSVSFPINRREIPRYFAAPKTEIEKTEQDIFFKKILREYTTLHLWNSIASALIPEPNSLVARILNKHCIHCSDVL